MHNLSAQGIRLDKKDQLCLGCQFQIFFCFREISDLKKSRARLFLHPAGEACQGEKCVAIKIVIQLKKSPLRAKVRTRRRKREKNLESKITPGF